MAVSHPVRAHAAFRVHAHTLFHSHTHTRTAPSLPHVHAPADQSPAHDRVHARQVPAAHKPLVYAEHPALLKPMHGDTVDAPEPASAFPVLACHRRLAVAAALFGSDAPPPRPNLAVTLAPLTLATATDWYTSAHARATEDRAKPCLGLP